MDSKTIIEVIDKLVGKTEAIGVSAIDIERTNNLKTLIDITNWCMDGLLYSAEHRHSFESSVRDNGELAYSTMTQIKQWLEDTEKELA